MLRNKPLMLKAIALVLGIGGIFLLTQCQAVKNIWMIRSGEAEQTEYSTTLDYEYEMGLMVVKADIEGETYRFILDSGSPLVGLNDSLAKALSVEQESTVSAGDTHGEEKTLPLGTLDRIRLGGVEFNDMTTFISEDLRTGYPFKCLDIDGIIGSNLMRHAVWQFDFRDTQIHIADRQSKLPDPDPAYTFPMDNKILEKPRLTNKAMGDQSILLDLASNGGFQMNKANLAAMKDSLGVRITDSAQRMGVSSFGLYGGSVDTVRHLLADSFSLSGMPVAPMRVRPNDEHILGMQFFKDYRLTLNWEQETIGFTPYANAQLDTNLVRSGFEPLYEGDALVVQTIYKPSAAWDAGLRYGDTITAVLSENGDAPLPGNNCELAHQKQFGGFPAADSLAEKSWQMVTQRNGVKDTFELDEIMVQ